MSLSIGQPHNGPPNGQGSAAGNDFGIGRRQSGEVMYRDSKSRERVASDCSALLSPVFLDEERTTGHRIVTAVTAWIAAMGHGGISTNGLRSHLQRLSSRK